MQLTIKGINVCLGSWDENEAFIPFKKNEFVGVKNDEFVGELEDGRTVAWPLSSKLAFLIETLDCYRRPVRTNVVQLRGGKVLGLETAIDTVGNLVVTSYTVSCDSYRFVKLSQTEDEKHGWFNIPTPNKK